MRTKDELEKLTEEYGGRYGLTHSTRLIKLVSIIANGKPYNEEVIEIAAYLHDWGGYEKWKIPGIDHALRSKEVAQLFLKQNGYSEEITTHVLECIEYHHKGNSNLSFEAVLLCDADAIDFLGIIGILREFSTKPRDLHNAYISISRRKEALLKVVHLETSKSIAEQRIKYMNSVLSRFDEESFGIY